MSPYGAARLAEDWAASCRRAAQKRRARLGWWDRLLLRWLRRAPEAAYVADGLAQADGLDRFAATLRVTLDQEETPTPVG